MAKYNFKFFLDYEGDWLWSEDEATVKAFGVRVDKNKLNISQKLKDDIEDMLGKHDYFIYDDDEEYYQKFLNEVARPIYDRLVKELGEECNVIYSYNEQKLWR